ncbi:MAG: hypothetical protein PHQ40_18660, partial [Anaerolineaceae bacterium]|nr:hypothetical protein [Anaerolineaceae bacterium]
NHKSWFLPQRAYLGCDPLAAKPPLSGQMLLHERGGEYLAKIEDLPAFKFQGTLTSARMQSLVSTLRKPFLERYLEGYLANPKLREQYRNLGKRNEEISRWWSARAGRR